jgi:Tol biopolymer transport system component
MTATSFAVPAEVSAPVVPALLYCPTMRTSPDARARRRRRRPTTRLPLVAAAVVVVAACHDGAGPDAAGPRFDRIAFERDSGGHAMVFVMNPDGSEQRRLTSDLAHAEFLPAISPDGRRVAFTRNEAGVYQLMVLDVDAGSAARRVATSVRSPILPSWSPDGRRLVFRGFDDAAGGRGWVLYTIDADGGGLTDVSARLPAPAGRGGDEEASFAPDGRHLALSVLVSDAEQRIYVADLARSTLRPLTSGPVAPGPGNFVFDDLPAWSPDGGRVAFTRQTPDGLHVYVIGADGSGERNLTPLSARSWGAAWSGDGTTLAYVDAAGQIHLMSADGVPGAALTGTAANQLPSWSRP